MGLLETSRLHDLAGVEWTEGVDPSPSAWGADVLSVDTTPTGWRGPPQVSRLRALTRDGRRDGQVPL
jgi:hypothetical protein